MIRAKNLSCVSALILIISYFGADALQCYVCRGCSEVTSEQLQTCSAVQPSTAAPTITTEDPSSTYDDTITGSSLHWTDPPTSTASTDSEATTDESTVTPESTDSTTDGSTVTPESTDSTTDGSTVTPESTDSTTDGSTVTPESTDSTTDASTVTPESTDSTTDGSTVTPESTDSTTDESTIITASDLTDENKVNHKRAKRHNPFYDMIMKSVKENSDDDDLLDARCLVTSYEAADGETIVIRGCAYDSNNTEEQCRTAIGENFDGTLQSCIICTEDGCNSSTRNVVASILITLSVFINIYSN